MNHYLFHDYITCIISTLIKKLAMIWVYSHNQMCANAQALRFQTVVIFNALQMKVSLNFDEFIFKGVSKDDYI